MRENLKIDIITENINDYRQEGKIYHPLESIVFITIAAVISGAGYWAEIEDFGIAKKEWLEKYVDLKNGIPSHDTISRFFTLIKPKEFQNAFLNWISAIIKNTGLDFVAIDGKTLRGSYNKKDDKAAIHMVSAWSNLNNCVLGQLKTAEKSNEITAIPELLKVIDVEGSIVTIDAMGTQKKIASKIIEQKADYILQVKGNQATLEKEIIDFFENKSNSKNTKSYIETSAKKEHGRLETRKYYISNCLDNLSKKDAWSGLNAIGMTESTRIVEGKTSINQKYYICSIPANEIVFANASRQHWGIENKLHWVLDVVFNEDQSRIRSGYAPENLATIKHIALAMLKKEASSKKSIARKRYSCALNDKYLEKVMTI
jgi:predicted transposase YbfD/YdcC